MIGKGIGVGFMWLAWAATNIALIAKGHVIGDSAIWLFLSLIGGGFVLSLVTAHVLAGQK